jgi:hypothetical protein
METNQFEQQLHESRHQTWERLMYVALGCAVAIVFQAADPLRDAVILFTLLYTTLSGFYLLWTVPLQQPQQSGYRRNVAFGHLIASWLTAFGIYSYSQLPSLGLVLLAYTVLLLGLYWRARKILSTSDQIFP